MATDLYEELGVDKEVTPESLKDAFRRRAQATHPDKGGAPGEFEAVKAAYEVLCDPERRRTYDETGQTVAQPSVEQEAEKVLAHIFQQYLDAEEVEEPVNSMREVIIDNRKRQRKQLDSATQTAKRLRTTLLGKLKRKKPGSLLLITVLEAKLRTLDSSVAMGERGMLVIDKMLDILNDWECVGYVEPAPDTSSQEAMMESIMNQFFTQGDPRGKRR